MKATKQDNETTSITPFPKLMINNNGFIVLFNSHGCGMVVFRKDGNWELGTVSWKIGTIGHNWNMEHFKDYNGKVILENDV